MFKMGIKNLVRFIYDQQCIVTEHNALGLRMRSTYFWPLYTLYYIHTATPCNWYTSGGNDLMPDNKMFHSTCALLRLCFKTSELWDGHEEVLQEAVATRWLLYCGSWIGWRAVSQVLLYPYIPHNIYLSKLNLPDPLRILFWTARLRHGQQVWLKS
jgi:hypothetical protein